MAGSRKGVLFDIDGTLVDDNYLHTVAWWQALRSLGYDVSMRDVHRRIGMGADRLVTSLLGHAEEHASTAHGNFYGPWLEQLRPFPCARELLEDCADRGLVVVLATSAKPDEVEALLRAIDPGDAVSTVTSSGDAERSKPAPDILEAALEKAGLRAEDCVFVGDTVYDVEAAADAGMPCIGVLSGGISADELRGAGAVELYDDVRALRQQLDDSAIGRLLHPHGSG